MKDKYSSRGEAITVMYGKDVAETAVYRGELICGWHVETPSGRKLLIGEIENIEEAYDKILSQEE